MKPNATPVELAGKRVVVTGASPGSLGAATATALAGWGASVVVTTRSNAAEAAHLIGKGVVGHPLDLTDTSSVDAFTGWYAREHDALDILINNAGIHLDLRAKWPQPHLTEDGYEIHWRTNYLGTMQLTHRLLPLVERAGETSGDARIVNVASKLHVRGRNEFLFAPLTPYHSWDAYGLSKLALVHASNEIARRYASSNVRSYSLHPGSVYTHIADRGLENQRVISVLRRALAPIEARTLLSPAQGAQTSLHCATAPALPAGYYRNCAIAKPSDDAVDGAVAARLWDDTVGWLAAHS
jgi:NAD(P)-dependent dehydrogenase (short-subunit alcohol dehydrogenase family)